MRRLVLIASLMTFCGLAWFVDLPQRVLGSALQYQRHGLPRYALAFLTAPRLELAPAPVVLRQVPVPGECRAGCLMFSVFSDVEAVDATLRFDDGSDTRPTIETNLVRFQVELTKPTDVWLTWKPQVFDPGFGSGFWGCGQALSEVSVRPTRLGEGRVGVRLTLTPVPGDLSFTLHGPQPYVP